MYVSILSLVLTSILLFSLLTLLTGRKDKQHSLGSYRTLRVQIVHQKVCPDPVLVCSPCLLSSFSSLSLLFSYAVTRAWSKEVKVVKDSQIGDNLNWSPLVNKNFESQQKSTKVNRSQQKSTKVNKVNKSYH